MSLDLNWKRDNQNAPCEHHSFIRTNTPITVFVRMEEQKVIVSDHGQASDYAFVNGVEPAVLKTRLNLAVRRYRLLPLDDEFLTEDDPTSFASAVLSVVGAVQDVGYLVYQQAR